MEKRLPIVALTAILLIPTLSIAFASLAPITSRAADSLWVEDSTTGATSYTWNTGSNHVGDTFTDFFCLNLSATETLCSWQVKFTFPSFLTVVNTTTFSRGPWMDGYDDQPISALITPTEMEAFDALIENATYSSIPGHAGVLFSVSFKINAAPTILTGPFTGAINVSFSNGVDT
jgi:hypothetical protein